VSARAVASVFSRRLDLRAGFAAELLPVAFDRDLLAMATAVFAHGFLRHPMQQFRCRPDAGGRLSRSPAFRSSRPDFSSGFGPRASPRGMQSAAFLTGTNGGSMGINGR
jgi:hypothetical protein